MLTCCKVPYALTDAVQKPEQKGAEHVVVVPTPTAGWHVRLRVQFVCAVAADTVQAGSLVCYIPVVKGTVGYKGESV